VEHDGWVLYFISKRSKQRDAISPYGLSRSFGLSLSAMSRVSSTKEPNSSKRHIDSEHDHRRICAFGIYGVSRSWSYKLLRFALLNMIKTREVLG
jgi:hypothetical protein